MEGLRRAAGRRKKRDLMKILEVLTFLIKSLGTSVCSSVLYLATLILFSAEVSASRCLFFCLSGSVHPEVGMGGGSGGLQDVETSEWV